jgi:hypothetical protein
MRFGPVPVADPLGAILAHGVPVASLGKGTVLGDWHIASPNLRDKDSHGCTS